MLRQAISNAQAGALRLPEDVGIECFTVLDLIVFEDGERAILNGAGADRLREFCRRNQVFLMVLAAFLVRLGVVIFGFRDQIDPVDHHAAFGWEMGWTARSIFEGRGYSAPFFPAT